jgi:hypothetical protein
MLQLRTGTRYLRTKHRLTPAFSLSIASGRFAGRAQGWRRAKYCRSRSIAETAINAHATRNTGHLLRVRSRLIKIQFQATVWPEVADVADDTHLFHSESHSKCAKPKSDKQPKPHGSTLGLILKCR